MDILIHGIGLDSPAPRLRLEELNGVERTVGCWFFSIG
jgi:hypothetical protein